MSDRIVNIIGLTLLLLFIIMLGVVWLHGETSDKLRILATLLLGLCLIFGLLSNILLFTGSTPDTSLYGDNWLLISVIELLCLCGTVIIGSSVHVRLLIARIRPEEESKPLVSESAGQKGTSERDLVEDEQEIMAQITGRQARPSRFRCFECGKIITSGKATCPDCGATQRRCIVCHQFIGQEELYSRCPRCEQLAHRSHLLEWIRVKGTCPYCKRRLRARDVA
ncbi:MAG: hypothetical protein ACFFCO_11885 [Promethearchaeota archaeon]